MPEPESDPAPSSLLPALVLVLLLAVLVGGWFLFPRVQAYMARQDCVAAGRVNCEG